MFINKTSDGLNNVCGKNISAKRKILGFSQRELADRLQIAGLTLIKMLFKGLNAASALSRILK